MYSARKMCEGVMCVEGHVSMCVCMCLCKCYNWCVANPPLEKFSNVGGSDKEFARRGHLSNRTNTWVRIFPFLPCLLQYFLAIYVHTTNIYRTEMFLTLATFSSYYYYYYDYSCFRPKYCKTDEIAFFFSRSSQEGGREARTVRLIYFS